MSIIADKLTMKYAPQSLNDVIIPARIKTKLEQGPKQHMLLYGTPGTGKTSTAVAMAKHFKMPYLLINASEETSVDVIREKISKFAATLSIMDGDSGSTKLVILDEVDGVSDQFNKALKAAMERFEKTTRFIATTNYINKVPDAVKSRFEQINYDFTDDEESELFKEYIKRVLTIGKKEGLSFTKESIVEFVKRKFPDMRSMLNSIQGFIDEGKKELSIEDVKKFSSVYKDVFELATGNIDPVNNYKYLVSNYSNKVDDVLASLGSEFIEYISMEKNSLYNKIPEIICCVAKYQADRVHVIDLKISMLACIFEIQTIVNK